MFRRSLYGPEYKALQKILIETRKSKGLTVRQLAASLGVSHSVLVKIEIGDRRLDVFEFLTICEALNLQPEQVLREVVQNSRGAVY